jgi:hypothetical protein
MKKFIPNAFNSLGNKWFVAQNHSDASDKNPGTEDKPFKTITRAAETMGRYDEVVISEGVYREEISLRTGGHVYMPEFTPHFIAKEGDEVYITGADPLECDWQKSGNSSFITPLPEKLFESNAYNPFALGLGRLFVDDEEVFQGDGWQLSDDGKSLVIDFDPQEKYIELTTRKRCFLPEFEGVLFIIVKGICVERAAEPGPFCLGRGKLERATSSAEIKVTRTFNLPGTSQRFCRSFTGEVGYRSTQSNQLIATVGDDTLPGESIQIYDIESHNHGYSWDRISSNRLGSVTVADDLFLDENHDFLIRNSNELLDGANPDEWVASIGKYQLVTELSDDEGSTWHSRQVLGKSLVPFRIHKLQSGDYILPCGKTRQAERDFHQDVVIFRGRYNELDKSICWQEIATIAVTPDESIRGLAEPHITSFADGRLIVLLRMGAILPTKDRQGVPSVKYYAVSDDDGETWTKPTALTYEDGEYIYSPRSYQDVFQSRKNNRVYAIFNICEEPTTGCDPRSQLQIMEIDPKTLCVKRDSIAMVEEKHPECNNLIRYSNWVMFENRKTLNPVLLMRASMSELCPIRHGYDMSSYRYEIELP